MELPNYFLADLPPQAVLSPDMVGEACQSLKRNRERYLAQRSTESLIRSLCELGENWLQPSYPLREHVLACGPHLTGFSAETLSDGINDFFSQFKPQTFQTLLLQDCGHLQRLDGLQANADEHRGNRASTARGPELLAHFAGGTLPNPPWTSIVLGMLARAAQFVKCPSGYSFLPRMFAHSIYEMEPKLGACLEVAEWKGGSESLEAVLFAEADCLTVMGSDETLAAVRPRVPSKTRFLAYGHRVSFGYVAHEMLKGIHFEKVISRAARDIIAWNQLGCLSPHLFYVETGGATSPEQFAEALARELQRKEETHPRGQLAVEEAADISARRAFYEVRAAHSPETRLWCSSGSTAWTVVFEADARFQSSCLNRFVYVKAVSGLPSALQGAETVREKISTVGLAAPEDRAQDLAAQLAAWGVTRICPLGQMQNPPLTWRHDGRPALGDLLTWTDWEIG